MAQIDLSFIEEGVKVIQDHLIMTVVIIGIAAIGSVVLFKYLNVPSSISKILTLIVVLVTFSVTIMFYYLPGIINSLN